MAAPRYPLDKSAGLAVTVLCRRCGYDLRSRRPDERCPECSLPVDRSLRGDALAVSDPQWVQRLRFGLMWLARSIVAIVAAAVLNAILQAGLGILGLERSWTGTGILRSALNFALLTVPLVGLAVATWLVTTPELAQDERQSLVSARLVARALIPISLMVSAMDLVERVASSLSTILASLSRVIAEVLGTVAIAISVAATAALMIHLSSLAKRVPAPKIADAMRTIAIGSIVCGTVRAAARMTASLLIKNVSGTDISQGSGSQTIVLSGVFGLIAGVAMLVGYAILIAGIVQIHRLNTEVERACRRTQTDSDAAWKA